MHSLIHVLIHVFIHLCVTHVYFALTLGSSQGKGED